MLYRIQTLYLFISTFIHFISISIFYNIDIVDIGIVKKEFILEKSIIILLFTCVVITILSICLFRKKKWQIIINKINIFINIVIIFTNIFIYLYLINSFSSEIKIIFFLLLCFLNVILYITANKYIVKDIKIIDSINRIR
ncbi:DUF4293 family protein [Blattabacterium cuenoti]|uniref:DUF4293 family protein n=1 Tax=Blattabacterium cuenoti TaxID=1653831 RepID=UPI00163C8FBF|nr:DUF4293 family protein [Blattabacterium cuenoti]